MLRIRGEQMAAFEEAMRRRFEERLVARVRKNFPRFAEIVGDRAIRAAVHEGCSKAEKHELRSEREMCLFVDVALMLGSGFATDPQLPWAAAALADEKLASPLARVEALHERTMGYLDEVVGEGQVFPLGAFLGARKLSLEELERRFGRGLEREALALFGEVWPAKSSYVGESALLALVKQARASAARYGITTSPGAGIYASFAFILGHVFDSDPLYPWVAETLKSPEITGEAARVRRLHSTAQAYINQALGTTGARG
ncbi:MAG: hypothetical protein FJ290_29795 [Planctomycetes bacterium]|nr:hypothetical protein [Planctomycetota bacterium]